MSQRRLPLACSQAHRCKHVTPKQHRSRHVNQDRSHGVLPDELPLLRECQHEVQEQRRLQHPRDDVAPVDCPVEIVQACRCN